MNLPTVQRHVGRGVPPLAADEACPLCGQAKMDGDDLLQCTGLDEHPTDDTVSRRRRSSEPLGTGGMKFIARKSGKDGRFAHNSFSVPHILIFYININSFTNSSFFLNHERTKEDAWSTKEHFPNRLQ
ncbi:hypothetical protein TNCV_3746361 [Trichonephila clavipes]|nr:hypothetical protein TNCV_3746361 [Trichonephila clavipes]